MDETNRPADTNNEQTPPIGPIPAGPVADTSEGVPVLLFKTPLGTTMVKKPPRSDYAIANCERAEHLIGLGMQEHEAFEAMGVSREQFYFWRADTLREQNADLQKLLRRYRRRGEKDSRKIAQLKEVLAASMLVDRNDEEVARDLTGSDFRPSFAGDISNFVERKK